MDGSQRITSKGTAFNDLIVSQLNKVSEPSLEIIRNLGVDRALRHFPNLVKRVVIPHDDIEAADNIAQNTIWSLVHLVK